jgi:hypothetical protein
LEGATPGRALPAVARSTYAAAVRRTIRSESERLERADTARTARAFERLLREDPPDPEPPARLGLGVEPREWIRGRKRERRQRVFSAIQGEKGDDSG